MPRSGRARESRGVRHLIHRVEQHFGALLKQLPNRSEVDALLTDINQAGLGRGLEFELFRPGAQRIAVMPSAMQ